MALMSLRGHSDVKVSVVLTRITHLFIQNYIISLIINFYKIYIYIYILLTHTILNLIW